MKLLCSIPSGLTRVPIDTMGQHVTCGFVWGVSFSQHKAYEWINNKGATSPN
jgi:hypothetical protein